MPGPARQSGEDAARDGAALDAKSALVDLVAAAMDAYDVGGEEALAAHYATLGPHVDAVRAGVEALRRFGLLEPPTAARRAGLPGLPGLPGLQRPPGMAALPSPALPARLGDFELAEPLGRGGMGVVYRARQVSLDREVAVKLVRPEQLHMPGVRQRFQREVEIVAKLQHEGIVRLYSYGEDHGLPWFAMELVHGVSLADVVQRFAGRDPRTLAGSEVAAALLGPLAAGPGEELFRGPWSDVAVRVVERAALALSESHRQGVLHRDLKPSNIMLTAQGRVVLLDFGLAWTPAAERLTRPGTELGTVHYMAPEQFEHASAGVDERSDVYALGVVLRELVTLRPVFTGATVDVVARQVREGLVAPFGRRGSSAAVQLETVCLVALDRDAERRYPTALAFARDLRRLLERRPIAAVRPSTWLRVRRYLQRHPAAAAASAVALAVVLAAPAVIAVRERGLRLRLEKANRELAAEITRADENLALAADALRTTLQGIDDEQLVQVPDLRGFVDKTLVGTGAFLDALLASNPSDPDARLRLAETLQRAAFVRWQFFDLPRTIPLFERVLELLEGAAGPPDRLDLLELDARLALVYLVRQSPQEAIAAYERALDCVRHDGPYSDRSFELRAAIAQCLERCGDLVVSTADEAGRARGRALLEESSALRTTLALERPSVETWLEVTRSERALSKERQIAQDPPGMAAHEAALDEALAAAERAAPGASDADLRQLAEALSSRTLRLRTDGLVADAALALEASARHWERIAATRPSRLSGLLGLLDVRGRLVACYQLLGRHDEAGALLESSVARGTAALELWPEEGNLLRLVLALRRRRAEHLAHCHVVRLPAGCACTPSDHASAMAELDAALALVERIAARGLRGAVLAEQCSRVHLARAILAARAADAERALGELAAGEARFADALRDAVDDRITLLPDPRFALVAAEALMQLGRDEEALARLTALRRSATERASERAYGRAHGRIGAGDTNAASDGATDLPTLLASVLPSDLSSDVLDYAPTLAARRTDPRFGALVERTAR